MAGKKDLKDLEVGNHSSEDQNGSKGSGEEDTSKGIWWKYWWKYLLIISMFSIALFWFTNIFNRCNSARKEPKLYLFNPFIKLKNGQTYLMKK